MQNPLLSFTSFPISGGVLVPVEGSVVYDGARGNRDKILPSPFPKQGKCSGAASDWGRYMYSIQSLIFILGRPVGMREKNRERNVEAFICLIDGKGKHGDQLTRPDIGGNLHLKVLGKEKDVH